MEELLELPGVARKTANVVLGTWFKKATGVVVDTHVQRLSRKTSVDARGRSEENRAGPDEAAAAGGVDQLLPPVIWHGRRLCTARKPKCGECPLAEVCPSAGKIA
jgi:endonuclease-3